MQEIKGSSVLILGYGREGQSLHRFLLKMLAETNKTETAPAFSIGVADKNPIKLIKEAAPDTATHSGSDYLQSVRNYDTIVHTPGMVMNTAELQPLLRNKYVTSSTNIFFSLVKGRTVGISGTKGKSTTSALTAAILSKKFADVRFAGNIGLPMLEQLTNQSEESIFVLELSSFQLEDIHYSPNVSILLNIVPEHLDHHAGFENYCQAKANIARFQKENDTLIVNPSNKVLMPLIKDFSARRFYFGEVAGAECLAQSTHQTSCSVFVKDNTIYAIMPTDSAKPPQTDAEAIISIKELPIHGPGNLQNAMAAISCALAMHVPLEKIRQAVREFKPLEHRLEYAGEWKKIRFFNDSLSTIPEAMLNALAALGDDVQTLIAGGYDRGIDYSKVGPALSNSQIQALVLFPITGEKIWQALCETQKTNKPQNKAGQTIAKIDVSDMRQAVSQAYKNTSSGRICLLSPASSSFNLFTDYRERGELFKRHAKELGES